MTESQEEQLENMIRDGDSLPQEARASFYTRMILKITYKTMCQTENETSSYMTKLSAIIGKRDETITNLREALEDIDFSSGCMRCEENQKLADTALKECFGEDSE